MWGSIGKNLRGMMVHLAVRETLVGRTKKANEEPH